MPPNVRKLSIVLLVVGMAAGFLLTRTCGMLAQAQATREAITCRVIESKTATTLGAQLVVFHHADAAAREQLSSFLGSHDGASIEFETAGGEWQPGTVFRLKSCFGRGLLAFSATGVHLAQGQTFLIRESAGGK